MNGRGRSTGRSRDRKRTSLGRDRKRKSRISLLSFFPDTEKSLECILWAHEDFFVFFLGFKNGRLGVVNDHHVAEPSLARSKEFKKSSMRWFHDFQWNIELGACVTFVAKQANDCWCGWWHPRRLRRPLLLSTDWSKGQNVAATGGAHHQH